MSDDEEFWAGVRWMFGLLLFVGSILVGVVLLAWILNRG
jgi:hypothetical protein